MEHYAAVQDQRCSFISMSNQLVRLLTFHSAPVSSMASFFAIITVQIYYITDIYLFLFYYKLKW